MAVSVVIAAKRPNILKIIFLVLVNTLFNDQKSSKRYCKSCCKEYHLHVVHLLCEIILVIITYLLLHNVIHSFVLNLFCKMCFFRTPEEQFY